MADNLGTSTFVTPLELIPSKIERYLSVTYCIAILELCREGVRSCPWHRQERQVSAGLKVHVCKHVTVGDAIVCRLLFPFWPSAEQRYHVRSIVL